LLHRGDPLSSCVVADKRVDDGSIQASGEDSTCTVGASWVLLYLSDVGMVILP
jgi:hypothetical protein